MVIPAAAIPSALPSATVDSSAAAMATAGVVEDLPGLGRCAPLSAPAAMRGAGVLVHGAGLEKISK